MDHRTDPRRRRDGSIDVEFYVARARRLRGRTLVQFFRAIGRRLLIAFRKLFKWLSLLVLGSVAATAMATQLRAGGDKMVFPERYAEGVMYTTVDRPVSVKPSATGLENTAQY